MHSSLLWMLTEVPVIVLGILIVLITIKLVPRIKPSHVIRIRASERCLSRLRCIGNEVNGPAKQFGYLRKRDPFVFEEMILTALKDRGYKIKRNSRYTGDGGSDGIFWINGEKVFIQAKRYQGSIDAAHVKEFSELCSKNRVKGIFVHTGKTGETARKNKAGHIDVVSGQRMLYLLTDRNVSLFQGIVKKGTEKPNQLLINYFGKKRIKVPVFISNMIAKQKDKMA